MNAKALLPILIALHVTAAALIVDCLGLRIEEPETVNSGPGWQAVELTPGTGCMSGLGNEELARFWSEPSATGAANQACANIR